MTATVLQFPWLGKRTSDGGKARITARRERLLLAAGLEIIGQATRPLNLAEPILDWRLDDSQRIGTYILDSLAVLG